MSNPMRTALEQELPDLTDGEWEWLVGKNYVEDAEHTPTGVADLVREIKDVRATRRRASDGEEAGRVADATTLARRASSRAEALSALLAADARRDDGVSAFRREVLRGKLLKPERVDTWIKARARKGEPAQRKVLGMMPDDRGDETIGGFPVIRYYRETLQYAVPGGRAVVNVGSTDTLERLRRLSESLASRYGWQPAQATLFVLTDAVPIIAAVRVGTNRRMPITATSRITLDVDPTVTPKEVASSYSRAQKAMLGGRSRRMQEKHLRLAIFDAPSRTGSWDERRTEWNRQHPDARYTNTRHFHRDAKHAVKRLLELPSRR